MVDKRVDGSRRKLLGAAAMGGAAALLLPILQTQASENQASEDQASEKMTRQQAQYQDTPNGIFSCATCSLFVEPKYCKVVEGEVSRDGWCRAFALAD
jgi:hypothetical protein